MRKLLAIILLCVLLLSSCSTAKYIEVPVKTVEERYIVKTETDSIIIKDSIDRYRNGDTLVIYKERTKYISSARTDTVVKTDSIPYLVTVEKEIKVNYLKWYQKWLIGFGGGSLLLLIAMTIIKLRKIKLW